MMASADDDDEKRRSAWFYDRIITPLNACSLETYVPVTITNNDPTAEEEVVVDASSSCGVGSTTSTVGRRRQNENNEVAVPLVIGCYQLNEQSTSEVTSAASSATTDGDNVKTSSSSRSGELRLYMISPSTSTSSSSLSDDYDGSQQQLQAKSNNTIKFGNASCVVQMESGVLDGKWRRRRSRDDVTTTQSSTGNIYGGGDGSNYYYESSSPLFASACASGKIHLHSLEKTKSNNNNVEQQQQESTTSWTLSHVTSSNQPDGEPICLSLAWNDFMNDYDTSILSREDQIVSSYSNGTVALHNVVYSTNCTSSSNDCNNDSKNIINMEETHRWNAHNMFGCPSEVWTCSFLKGNTNVVLSGADDGTLKSWDVRNTQRHVYKIGDNAEFEAGVTSISSHPTFHHVFAVGSYDEYVRIYDYRRMDNKEPMAKVHVGGGVWRIKWHPSCWEDDDTSTSDRRNNNRGKILVAAMHGGCRIVNIPGLGNNAPDDNNNAVEILSQFTAHESMAYGADWISFGKCKEAVAASCSFYDRQAFLWGPSDNTNIIV